MQRRQKRGSKARFIDQSKRSKTPEEILEPDRVRYTRVVVRQKRGRTQKGSQNQADKTGKGKAEKTRSR